MSNPLCIGHVHLKVSDLKKVLGFYKEMLGFRVSERVNGYVFLTFGKKHHDLALQELANARKPSFLYFLTLKLLINNETSSIPAIIPGPLAITKALIILFFSIKEFVVISPFPKSCFIFSLKKFST